MKRPFEFCPYCGTSMQDVQKFGHQRRVCPKCDFVQFFDPKVAASTFILQNGKVLLIKRAVEPEEGKWALPAGYIDYGEDPVEAAVRETQEETGLEVEITGLHDVMLTHALNDVILIIYYARPIRGELRAADDAEEAAWFAPDELPELAFESTRLVLNRWISGDGSVRQLPEFS